MAKMPVCKHCGKTKRGHLKSNRGNFWWCTGGTHTWFEPKREVLTDQKQGESDVKDRQ